MIYTATSSPLASHYWKSRDARRFTICTHWLVHSIQWNREEGCAHTFRFELEIRVFSVFWVVVRLLLSTATAVLHPNKFISIVFLIGYFDFELMKRQFVRVRAYLFVRNCEWQRFERDPGKRSIWCRMRIISCIKCTLFFVASEIIKTCPSFPRQKNNTHTHTPLRPAYAIVESMAGAITNKSYNFQ